METISHRPLPMREVLTIAKEANENIIKALKDESLHPYDMLEFMDTYKDDIIEMMERKVDTINKQLLGLGSI